MYTDLVFWFLVAQMIILGICSERNNASADNQSSVQALFGLLV